MTAPILCLKIDVDTERGTKIGVPNLMRLLMELNIPATFLFSLGPDNTGRALRRIFRPGFLKKVTRTNVVGTYGIKTLLNGVLWPGPHIAKRHSALLRDIKNAGFEVGIHSYDHFKWQDYVMTMTYPEIRAEFTLAQETFKEVFATEAKTAGAPGWQANQRSLQVYDEANLIYASDCRGTQPFFPSVENKIFNTLQLPTTLPTLDELLGRPEFPESALTAHYLSLIKPKALNIFTMHAEIEGMSKLNWFQSFLKNCLAHGIGFKSMLEVAQDCLRTSNNIVCELIHGEIEGRSGRLAKQGKIKCILN